MDSCNIRTFQKIPIYAVVFIKLTSQLLHLKYCGTNDLRVGMITSPLKLTSSISLSKQSAMQKR